MARRRNPYPALVVVGLLPALLLGGCWRFADSRTSPTVTVDVTPTTGSTPLPVVLSTPAMSVRRTPAILSRDVSIDEFAAELDVFAAGLDDSSCMAVAVDGAAVTSKNATTSLRPASNVKVITAAVALEVLGADHTFTTEIRGSLANGVVSGDLYLVGGGDPLLNNEWWEGPNAAYPPFNSTSVEQLAQLVKAAGVTRIDGAIVGDASRYDDEWYPPTWTSDVRFTEGGPVSALLMNDSRESNTQSSDDPVVGAATVLTDQLTELGVQVAGQPAAGVAPADAPLVTSIESQPLPAVLAEMLTTSDNNTAELMLKEIGLRAGGAGTREAGLAAVTAALRAWGVPLEGVTLVDGSGLSDENRLTCAALLAVVQHQAVDDPVGAGMAVAGQAGGTLADAYVGTALEGVLRGKTGTLYNYDDGVGGKPAAKTLSGFVPVEGGGAIEFALLLNGPQIAEQVQYRPIWDAFGAALSTYPSGPTAVELGPR